MGRAKGKVVMSWNPYIEAAIHALLVLCLLGFMFVRISRPIAVASAPHTDRGQWVLPTGALIAVCLLRLVYLIDSKQILGYPM